VGADPAVHPCSSSSALARARGSQSSAILVLVALGGLALIVGRRRARAGDGRSETDDVAGLASPRGPR
jgi:hypothetical protein